MTADRWEDVQNQLIATGMDFEEVLESRPIFDSARFVTLEHHGELRVVKLEDGEILYEGVDFGKAEDTHRMAEYGRLR